VPIEGVLLSPLFVPHFTVGLGFLILAAQIGLARSLYDRRRLPRDPGSAIRAAQRLRLVAQSRSAAWSLQRPVLARRRCAS
jgi:hypothetical protein